MEGKNKPGELLNVTHLLPNTQLVRPGCEFLSGKGWVAKHSSNLQMTKHSRYNFFMHKEFRQVSLPLYTGTGLNQFLTTYHSLKESPQLLCSGQDRTESSVVSDS